MLSPAGYLPSGIHQVYQIWSEFAQVVEYLDESLKTTEILRRRNAFYRLDFLEISYQFIIDQSMLVKSCGCDPLL